MSKAAPGVRASSAGIGTAPVWSVGRRRRRALRLTMDDGARLLYPGTMPRTTAGRPARRRRRPPNPFSHPPPHPFETAARRLASAGVRCPEFCSVPSRRVSADMPCRDVVAAASKRCGNRSRAAGALWPCCDWLAPCPRPVRVIGEGGFVDAGRPFARTSCEGSHARTARCRALEIAGATCEPLPPRIGSPKTLHSRPAIGPARSDTDHGELGPDQSCLDRAARPVLIDIRGRCTSTPRSSTSVRMRSRALRKAEQAALTRTGSLLPACLHLDRARGPLRIAITSHRARGFRDLAERTCNVPCSTRASAARPPPPHGRW